MRDYKQKELEKGRPRQDVGESINFCLKRLFDDTGHDMMDTIVYGLTFEELIGALLQARDLTVETDRERNFPDDAED